MDKGEATIKMRATKSSEGDETKNGRGQAVGYYHDIPQDIVVDVLAKLPAKSLMRFRCVCKTWSSLIRDPLFVHLHQNQSLNKPCKTAFLISSKNESFSSYIFFADHEGKQAFDKETITITKSGRVLGIANGLACIVNDKCDISVYNLSTHETTTIPPPPRKIGFKHHLFFGFDPLANEYKVVKFLSYEKEGFEIFTLGSKQWRKINREHYNFYGDTKWYDFKEPICVNGVIYWIVKFMAESIDITLHSFDLHGEKFQQVVLQGHGLSLLRSRLIQIGGCLAVVQATVCENKFYLQMLQDYHNKVWIHKIIGIPLSPNIVRYPTLAGTIGTGELLILDDHFSKYFRLFYNIMGSKRFRSAQIAMPSFIGESKWKAFYGTGYSQTGEKDWRLMHLASIFSFHHVENILPLKEDN